MSDTDCGVTNTLKVIGSKWTVLILRDLIDGKKRFGELHRSLKGISPKTLSIRLQELEREKIVKKKIFAEIPLHVEYSLTDKGQSLNEIICAMRQWGECHKVLSVKKNNSEITTLSAD
jgi:DNA-binding HxlR family transcriptional regulator